VASASAGGSASTGFSSFFLVAFFLDAGFLLLPALAFPFALGFSLTPFALSCYAFLTSSTDFPEFNSLTTS
jgi:hypothetical protein